MTDIQRQLKHIHKLALTHLDSENNFDVFKNELQTILPKSYGITSGYIVDNKDNQSEWCDIIIYDEPLANGIYADTSTHFHIKHVLLILHIQKNYTEQDIKEVLTQIASVKDIVKRKQKLSKKKLPPRPERREKIPRSRLPVSLVYCNHIGDSQHDVTEKALTLHTYLTAQSVENSPDYIYILKDDLLYRNPTLDSHLPILDTDIGISHIDEWKKPRHCYQCKEFYMRRHFFYKRFCIRCGDENYIQRLITCDLKGYIAIVTGARVKIGYAVALRLLRAGAKVIITTRFPNDAAKRYSQEPDFKNWQENLQVYGLDMRDIRAVKNFVQYIQAQFTQLDIIINNAAQTVRRPPAFYKHLLPLETTSIKNLPAPMQSIIASNTNNLSLTNHSNLVELPINSDFLHSTQIPLIDGDDIEDKAIFPPDQYDMDGQQIDNRTINSWTMPLDKIQIPELLEVYLVNAITPSILVGQLRKLMKNSKNSKRFIVNVSAVEGQFSGNKQGIHPHTCMAKAALNMLTHSTAPDYQENNIYITSVDPGWVSDQMPHADDKGREINQRLLPIDLEDAAARVCHPIFEALNNKNILSDVFLKDYHIVDW